MEDIRELTEEERRAQRRRRRHKKRVTAWITFVILVLSVFVLCFLGIAYFKGFSLKIKENPIVNVSYSAEEEPIPESDTIQDAIENLVKDEDAVEVKPPESIEVEPTEEELFEEAVANYVASMTLEDKVAGMFIVTPEELTGVPTVTVAGDGTKEALSKYPVGGIVYSAKNMQSQDKFIEIIKNTVLFTKYPTFLALDEELGYSSFSSSMKNEKTMKSGEIGELNEPSVAYAQEEIIAKYMSGLGLNLNLGVVADSASEDSFMNGHSFGNNVDLNGQMTIKALEALKTYGVTGAVKYFPGQGMASKDTSDGRSTSIVTRDDLNEKDLKTFTAAFDAGAKMVIVSHEVAEELTGKDERCSASKFIMTELLRVELGYDDLVIVTDSLSKGAVSDYEEPAEACITSIKAGADMVMCPGDFEAAYTGVLNAVNNGVIAKERVEDSLIRIYKLKLEGMSAEEINGMILQ